MHDQFRCYQTDRRRSLLRRCVSALLRLLLSVVLVVAVFSGGFWLLATVFSMAIGLLVGLVSLMVSLVPLLIGGWLLWLVVKAILV